ncbi:MAG TPA: ATP-binding protein [Vicinamibacterales bacterium]|jgi:signal transduction histidine kinase
MNPSAYALVGLTALVAALVGTLVFAVLRFGSAVRDVRRQLHEGNAERAFVAAALEDSLRNLKNQERAMAARAETSERLSAEIITSLASGLLVVSLDGDVRMLNPAGRRILRLTTVSPAIGFRALLADAAPLADLVDECLTTAGPIVRRAVPLRRPDGSVMHVGVTASPLCDEQGSLQGAICLFSDLTAVVELEEQLRLKETLARLGELTAGLAHEFRNGLATIHGYARLIDPSQLTPAPATYVQGIRDETEALGQVVTNFLNFAKPAQLTLVPVDIGHLIARVTDEFRAEVEARHGTLEMRGTFSTVDGDEVLLRQAFANLLRNALDACAGTAVAPRLVVDGVIDPAQHLLRVSVCDNGPGIDPAMREKVFRPFFTTKGHGTGLGLALVQKIIVTHNGRIAASESETGGATFQIVLPLSGAS